MIASEKSHKNPSTKTSFYSKKDLRLIEISFFSSEKIRNSGNCIYDYAQFLFQCAILVNSEQHI